MTHTVAVEVLGRSYQIKCAEQDVALLQQAACALEEKMRALRQTSQALTIDRLAILTALYFSHQLLTFEQNKQKDLRNVNEHLRDILNTMEDALARHAQLEL